VVYINCPRACCREFEDGGELFACMHNTSTFAIADLEKFRCIACHSARAWCKRESSGLRLELRSVAAEGLGTQRFNCS